jgi:hypothetical protein
MRMKVSEIWQEAEQDGDEGADSRGSLNRVLGIPESARDTLVPDVTAR